MWRVSGSHFATLAGILINIPGELCYILYLLCTFKLKKEMKHLEDCRSSYEAALKKFKNTKHVDKRSKVSFVDDTYISEWQFKRTFIFILFIMIAGATSTSLQASFWNPAPENEHTHGTSLWASGKLYSLFKLNHYFVGCAREGWANSHSGAAAISR